MLVANIVSGHGGGLNSRGCHNDNVNGGYHCHNGGESKTTPTESTTPVVEQPVLATEEVVVEVEEETPVVFDPESLRPPLYQCADSDTACEEYYYETSQHHYFCMRHSTAAHGKGVDYCIQVWKE